MSGIRLVHLVHNALRDLPVCIQFIYTVYGGCMPYEFREPHRSLQRVYEIAVCFTLLATTCCITVSGVGLVHLVYNALRDLPVCIQFIYTAYGSCTVYQFREPYGSIQHVYEIAVCCRLLSTTWCSAVSGVGLVYLVYSVLCDLPVFIQYTYRQPMVVVHCTKLENRTDTYRGCTKFPFVSDCSPRPGV